MKFLKQLNNQRGSALVYVMVLSTVGIIFGGSVIQQMSANKKRIQLIKQQRLRDAVMGNLIGILSNPTVCSQILQEQLAPPEGSGTPIDFNIASLDSAATVTLGTKSFLKTFSPGKKLGSNINLKEMKIQPSINRTTSNSFDRAAEVVVTWEVIVPGGSSRNYQDSLMLSFTDDGGSPKKIQNCLGVSSREATNLCNASGDSNFSDETGDWDASQLRCNQQSMCENILGAGAWDGSKCE